MSWCVVGIGFWTLAGGWAGFFFFDSCSIHSGRAVAACSGFGLALDGVSGWASIRMWWGDRRL